MVNGEKARVTATAVPRPLGFRRERSQSRVTAPRSLSWVSGGPGGGAISVAVFHFAATVCRNELPKFGPSFETAAVTRVDSDT